MSGTYGFIGLGSQGAPMAHRIVDAGLPLAVWARRAELLEAYTAKGAHAAASVAGNGGDVRPGRCLASSTTPMSCRSATG